MDFTLKTKVGLDTSNVQSQLDQAGMKAVFTVKTSITGGGAKEVTTYKDALNNTAKTVTTFNAAGQQTSTILKSVKENTSGASTVIGQLGRDFLDTTAKVLKFGASTAIIAGVTAAITESINVVKEFDAAVTEFRKVSDLSGESLKNYTDQLAKMGELTGSTMTDMVEASTQFKKSGYSDQDSAKLASVAEMYRNIADEELSAGDAASFIISQIKAFNMTADDSMHIIDAVNEVDITCL